MIPIWDDFLKLNTYLSNRFRDRECGKYSTTGHSNTYWMRNILYGGLDNNRIEIFV